jgi:hypothetical protein
MFKVFFRKLATPNKLAFPLKCYHLPLKRTAKRFNLAHSGIIVNYYRSFSDKKYSEKLQQIIKQQKEENQFRGQTSKKASTLAKEDLKK